MKRAGTILVVLAAAVAAFAASAGAGESYTDPTGDGSPDISLVTVNHDANGIVTLSLTVVGLSTPTAPGTRRDLSVFAEPDDDTSPAPAPYNLIYEEWASGTACQLLKDNGTSYWPVPSSIGCAKSGDTVSWTFPKSDIGAQEMFSFRVITGLVSDSGQVLGVDVAPETGRWGYSFAPAPVSPVIGKAVPSPRQPVAGKPFRVSFAVTRSDTDAPLTAGTMRCDPTIGRRLVPHTERFGGGVARVTVRVPRAAKGKRLVLRLTVTSNGRTATRLTAFRVAR